MSFLYFGICQWTWALFNYYFSRYVYDDVTHELLIFLHMTGVLIMMVNIYPGMVEYTCASMRCRAYDTCILIHMLVLLASSYEYA